VVALPTGVQAARSMERSTPWWLCSLRRGMESISEQGAREHWAERCAMAPVWIEVRHATVVEEWRR
jgi:hypothetical protein